MSGRYDELREVAGDVSRETLEKLTAFEAILRKWANRINLVSPSTLADVWHRHILDSAQLARLEPDALRWIDLGSGGGFPGAVVAILLAERLGSSIALVESNNKKAAFLQAALGELGTRAQIVVARIQDAPARISFHPEVVTARALAPLPELIALAYPWLSNGAKGLFHKGREYREEIVKSAHAWSFDLLEHESAIDPLSVILEVANPQRID